MNSIKSKVSIFVIITLFIFNISICFPAQSDVLYTVMPGDNIFKIAAKFNVPHSQIIDLNKIQNPSFIIPGQVIIISRTEQPVDINSTVTPQSTPSITNTPESTPIAIDTPIPTVAYTPSPTPTTTQKPIGPPEEMDVSVNFVNADTKMVLQALALSMDKKVIMFPEAKQKNLSFKADNTPLLAIMDLVLKNENATAKNLGNTIVIEVTK
jgi:spore germination protein YaaH